MEYERELERLLGVEDNWSLGELGPALSWPWNLFFHDSNLGVSDALVELEDADKYLEREGPVSAVVSWKVLWLRVIKDECILLTTAALGTLGTNCGVVVA